MSTLRQQHSAQRRRYLTLRQRTAHRAKRAKRVAVVGSGPKSSWWATAVRLIRKVIA